MVEPVYLKAAGIASASATDPAVRERVSEMLHTIEQGGIDAVRRYSRELDGWDPPSFEVSPGQRQAKAE